MIPLSLRQVRDITGADARAVDGDLDALLVDGPVVTDSREAGPRGLYVARIGETRDGHDFVPQAISAGCTAALTSRPVEGFPCLVVPDVQAAFAALARAVIGESADLTVIGITGSSGKTSTKDLLGEVLGGAAPTVVPDGSLNSEVGVPLTVCRVEPDTRYLVVEMGARGIGHIAYLTEIAPPRIAVVLNVGSAHVGEFGSREAIAVAKSELPAALTKDGVAVLNGDDSAVRAMGEVTQGEVVLVGRGADCDVRAVDVTLDGQGRPSFTVVTRDARADVTLPLHGVHHVDNALAVIAVALRCGLDLAGVAKTLATVHPPSRWRMEVRERRDGVTVVNDAYNANPHSMAAGLRALTAMSTGRRSWAVLGSMLELGADSETEHAAIGALVAELGVARLLVVGEIAQPMLDGARSAGLGEDAARWFPDTEAAQAVLERELAPGDVVLLKSSRDAGLRWLGDRLAPSTDPDPNHPDQTDPTPEVRT